MGREREDFFRESGTIPKEKVIVIAYEGSETEKLYFEALRADVRFNDDIICLHLLSRPKGDTNSAPNHVFAKLKREAKDAYNFNLTDELWMVIDKDRWKNIPEMISRCKAEGNMYIAGSNPCFEFWLLLHVVQLTDFADEELATMLANPKISAKRTHLDKLLSDLLPDGYNKSNPKPHRYIANLNTAVTQAEILDNPQEDFPSKLGSHVYKIVKAIMV